MSKLDGRIDFELLVTVDGANPNGDPLEAGRPRIRSNGFGEISDVCIKRKIRNRLQDMGHRIFVQMESRADDGFKSLKARADGCEKVKALLSDKNADLKGIREAVCGEWMDVRMFGQVFAFKGSNTSVGIRGPVTINHAVSVSPIEIETMQIIKTANSEEKAGKASDTMGTKYLVPFGLYVVKGSISGQVADVTGFSKEDAEILKYAMKTMFENDASATRAAGSMEVRRMYWWEHESRTPGVSTAAVHRSVIIMPKTEIPGKFEDYDIELKEIDGIVKPQITIF